MTHDYGQGESTLSQGADRVLAAMADFTAISNRMTDQIAAVQGQWAGSGHNAFQILSEAWNEKQTMIVNALNDFADSLGVTQNINLAQDDDVAGNVQLLQGRLG